MSRAVPNRTPHVKVKFRLVFWNVCRSFGEEILFVI